ncbi:glycosyltransferase family 2 protein [Myxococcota bacterium]|nr:glycosyltransferase family 2 protein [Myxococcota bacterium]
MRVVAVVPVHNEIAASQGVVRAAGEASDAVLVVDDGSTDGTGEAMASLAAGLDTVAVLTLRPNRGKAVALAAAFRSVLAWADAGLLEDGDALVTLDGDGQHPPSAIPDLAARIGPGGADLAIGRRDLSRYPPSKRLGNRVLSGWGRLCSGFPFADLECGMRAIRISALRRVLPYFGGRRYSGEHEVGVIAARLGLAIDDGCPIEGGPYVAGARPADALSIMLHGAAASGRAAAGRPARPHRVPELAPPPPSLAAAARAARRAAP